jgi:hypothetical protein
MMTQSNLHNKLLTKPAEQEDREFRKRCCPKCGDTFITEVAGGQEWLVICCKCRIVERTK